MLVLDAWHRCANTALHCARAGIIASLCSAGSPNASVAAIDTSPNNPKIQALLQTPEMFKGIAAAHKGDVKAAVAYFQAAARHGNQMGNIVLALSYFDGRGVRRDRPKAIALLYGVIHRNEDPTGLVALQIAQEWSKVMQASPDPKEREASMGVLLGAWAMNPYVQQWGENMSHVRVIPCFMC